MKPALLVLAAVTAAGIHQVLIAPALHDVTASALSDDARMAIELRCGDAQSSGARDCRARLERLYASGSLDPDKTLRAYCESVKSQPWGHAHTAPPKVCVDRYGGW